MFSYLWVIVLCLDFCFQHYFYLLLSKISNLKNVVNKFELSFSLVSASRLISFLLLSKSVISKLFSPAPQGPRYKDKID